MKIVALDHIQLAMPPGSEPEARVFYKDILGFEEIAKPDLLRLRGGCWFTSADAEIHLGIEEDFHPARKAHPAFRVTDLDSLEKLLVSKGFTVTRDTSLLPIVRFYVSDPFGNRIEFIQDGGTR
jgi:catechol 2,3-dioxygenase-like lactoylglutathione lyase family enzyme